MKKLLLFLLFATCRIIASAQDGTLDMSFDPVGGPGGNVSSISIQADGKIIIVGDFGNYRGSSRNCIARVNTDGTLDATFNPGGGVFGSLLSSAIQSDGKILIGGSFVSYNGISINNLARVNADGSLDTTFHPATPSNAVTCIRQLPTGKILIAGGFITLGGVTSPCIARLNADGSRDTTFTSHAAGGIDAFDIQSDGKIVIVGTFPGYSATLRERIARINPDGSLDASFDPGTGASYEVWSVSIQQDGKILIAGGFANYNGLTTNGALEGFCRVNTDGSLDTTFNPGGTGMVPHGYARTVTSLNTGKILVTGGFTSYNGTSRNYITRVNADGSLDASFDPGTAADNAISAHAVQSDGKIIIAGTFLNYNGTSRKRLARLNNTPSGISELAVGAVSLYPDPSSGRFTVDMGSVPAKAQQINISNMLGQSIYRSATLGQKTVIDLSTAVKGAYIVRVGEGKEAVSRKIVIQ